MRAHLVQFDIAWEDRFRNFEKVERLINSARTDPGDFVLLPEMFDTGFSVNTTVTADKSGETLSFLRRLATDLSVYVQGGRTVHPSFREKASNVSTTISPGGEVLAEYSKTHLFTLGKEGDAIQPGTDLYVWKWGGTGTAATDAKRDEPLVVFPAICYDLRFPELFRAGLAMGAEIFALGACWPEARHSHWRALLTARAIENQAFAFGVNRVGTDPTLHYLGGSVVVSPKGEVLGELGDNEGVLSVEIDAGELRRWRRVFPAWKDGNVQTPSFTRSAS